MSAELLTTKELAALWHVHRHTIERECKAQRLGYILIGGQRRFSERHINDYQKSRERKGKAA